MARYYQRLTRDIFAKRETYGKIDIADLRSNKNCTAETGVEEQLDATRGARLSVLSSEAGRSSRVPRGNLSLRQVGETGISLSPMLATCMSDMNVRKLKTVRFVCTYIQSRRKQKFFRIFSALAILLHPEILSINFQRSDKFS